MKITRLHVTNFKSIKDLELINPNPFSVFVGPNGAGKSNIFEALEFAVFVRRFGEIEAVRTFGGAVSILSFHSEEKGQSFTIKTELNEIVNLNISYKNDYTLDRTTLNIPAFIGMEKERTIYTNELFQIIVKFSRIFLNALGVKKINSSDDSVLNSDASNIEQVLQRILKKEQAREEIIEWLQVLIPEFKDIQIETSNLSGEINYAIYEKHSNKPFPKHLISDGTKNILALLTAVYQSDEPQFLCIEEPENGLHPQVIEALVRLFRNACKEKGHYIWLNTHSQTLVRQLTVDEIIVVDKKEGSTKARQFTGEDLHGLKMDDAWLTNALGGGLI